MELRISKYSPINRDQSGVYLLSEWTDSSEVGCSVGGFTIYPEEYFLVENKYITLVVDILGGLECSRLQIDEMEIHFADGAGSIINLLNFRDEVARIVPKELLHNTLLILDEFNCIGNEMIVEKKFFSHLLKLIFRNVVWCKLHSSFNTYIHFGYDFYVYIGSDKNLEKRIFIPEGIYVEQFVSPYHAR